jgi:uncharacterized protein YbjT (DUF2867 family)
MKVIVTGATGMVGSEVVRQAIEDNDISEVITLARKPLNIEHAKVKNIIHKDFMDYSSLHSILASCDACIWCLGVSQLQVDKKQYEVITYDYAMAAAKALLAVNSKICFVFVSGDGADPSGKSNTLFAKVKGRAEKDLMALPFEKLIIARPGGIKPVHKNLNAPFLYKLFYLTYPVWKTVTPSKVITSVELAKGLLHAAKKREGKIVLKNEELKK